MDPFPILETRTLRLRKPTTKDLPKIREYANNSEIAKMTLNIPHPYQEKDAIFWLNRANQGFEDKSKYVFAICKLSNDDFIGGISLKINSRFNRAELGYWIAEPFWNKGFATEATQETLRFGFEEAGIHKIFATHLLDNPASGKVMTKNGMTKEWTLIDHFRKDDTYLSVVQYRLTKKEFNNQ